MSQASPLERLLTLERFGIRPGLERIHALLDRLGHPETGLRIIQVAGTNGKGSVSALCEAILRAAGLRTGLYVSPHLRRIEERIRVDGRGLDPGAALPHLAAIDGPVERGEVTFFEAMTAVALAAFREARVDVAVLEVGLGGRWDATTVGTPDVAVVTRIGLDHQAYLGHRVEEIAAEKAAIIRGGVAITASQVPEARRVIADRCRAVGVPLWVEGEEIGAELLGADLAGQRLDITGPAWQVRDLRLRLLGTFQAGNAALAVAAARRFAEATGHALPEAAIRAGCAGVEWPGRFQVVPGRAGWPTLVLDGGHNVLGAEAVAASLARYFPGASTTLVVGVSEDKDRRGILGALLPVASRLVLTRSASPRATLPRRLAEDLPASGVPVVLAEDVATALDLAVGGRGVDLVCATGSLFVVGDALDWLERRSAGGLPAGDIGATGASAAAPDPDAVSHV